MFSLLEPAGLGDVGDEVAAEQRDLRPSPPCRRSRRQVSGARRRGGQIVRHEGGDDKALQRGVVADGERLVPDGRDLVGVGIVREAECATLLLGLNELQHLSVGTQPPGKRAVGDVLHGDALLHGKGRRSAGGLP